MNGQKLLVITPFGSYVRLGDISVFKLFFKFRIYERVGDVKRIAGMVFE